MDLNIGQGEEADAYIRQISHSEPNVPSEKGSGGVDPCLAATGYTDTHTHVYISPITST